MRLVAAAVLGPVLLAGSALAGNAVIMTDTPWTQAPSFADLAAVYTPKARARDKGGQVMLSCVFGAEGRLHHCDAVSQSPNGYAAMAMALTLRFLGPLQLPTGKTIAGARAQIVFKFTPDMFDPPMVSRPEWLMLPTPASFQAAFPEAASRAGVLKAKAVMNCTVTATGGLTACQTLSEEPAGFGFGQATLPLAAAFKLKLWGADGRPVVGGRVRVPIRYELEQAAVPAAPKP